MLSEPSRSLVVVNVKRVGGPEGWGGGLFSCAWWSLEAAFSRRSARFSHGQSSWVAEGLKNCFRH